MLTQGTVGIFPSVILPSQPFYKGRGILKKGCEPRGFIAFSFTRTKKQPPFPLRGAPFSITIKKVRSHSKATGHRRYPPHKHFFPLMCLNAKKPTIYLSTWPPPPGVDRAVELQEGPVRTTGAQGPGSQHGQDCGTPPSLAGKDTRPRALCRRCSSDTIGAAPRWKTFCSGSSCSPLQVSFPADGNKANKKAIPYFTIHFREVFFFPPSKKRKHSGVCFNTLEEWFNSPHFHGIRFFASKNVNLFKRSIYFKKFFMKGFRVPLTPDYIMFPLTSESQNAQSRISKPSLYFLFSWIPLPLRSIGLLPQASTEGLANAEHIWRP